MSRLSKILYTGKIHRNWLKDFPGNILTHNNENIELVIGSSKLLLKFNIHSENYSITLPIVHITETTTHKYDFIVNWGDGTEIHYTTYDGVTHEFTKPGEYIISIKGEFFGFDNRSNYDSADNPNPWEYLTRIISWGSCNIWFLNYRFCWCKPITSNSRWCFTWKSFTSM